MTKLIGGSPNANSVESWRIVEPVLDAWQEAKVPLDEYRAGTTGPETWEPLP